MKLMITTAHAPRYITPRVRLVSHKTEAVSWSRTPLHTWVIEGAPIDVNRVDRENNLDHGYLGSKVID